MGSAESEVGSTAAELQVIPPFLQTLSGPPESFARMGRGGQVPILSGPSESFARMGSAKSRGPRKSLILGESGGLGRPLIKWSGNQPCDSSAERDVLAHTLPPPLSLLPLPDRFANLEI